MAWLYQEKTISTVFLALIIATPVVAAVGAAIHRLVAKGIPRPARIGWMVLALSGPANYGLWRLFNVIEDYWGLDRVKPLLINFAIFVSLGVAIGLILRVVLRAGRKSE